MKTLNMNLRAITFVLALTGCLLPGAFADEDDDDGNYCQTSARKMLQSNIHEAWGDYWLAIAKAKHLPSNAERREAAKAAREELAENLEGSKEQLEARKDLCAKLGEKLYHPVVNPRDFVDRIDNPYLPLIPGTVFLYGKVSEEGTETVRVEVTRETKEILGVRCTVVRDTVRLKGELVEDTLDYFAQDEDRNVWYFGESSREFKGGELASLEGSWKAGVDGAKPGIVMQANPMVGKTYRQEFLPGTAEDAATVVSLGEYVSVPYGRFRNVLKTEDFSPLEPDHKEFKYYHPGTGLVLEEDPETGERIELMDIQRP